MNYDVICPTCGFSENPANVHYCGKCGKPMPHGIVLDSLIYNDSTRIKVVKGEHYSVVREDYYNLLYTKYKSLHDLIEKERRLRDRSLLKRYKNDSFLSSLEAIIQKTEFCPSDAPNMLWRAEYNNES